MRVRTMAALFSIVFAAVSAVFAQETTGAVRGPHLQSARPPPVRPAPAITLKPERGIQAPAPDFGSSRARQPDHREGVQGVDVSHASARDDVAIVEGSDRLRGAVPTRSTTRQRSLPFARDSAATMKWSSPRPRMKPAVTMSPAASTVAATALPLRVTTWRQLNAPLPVALTTPKPSGLVMLPNVPLSTTSPRPSSASAYGSNPSRVVRQHQASGA